MHIILLTTLVKSVVSIFWTINKNVLATSYCLLNFLQVVWKSIVYSQVYSRYWHYFIMFILGYDFGSRVCFWLQNNNLPFLVDQGNRPYYQSNRNRWGNIYILCCGHHNIIIFRLFCFNVAYALSFVSCVFLSEIKLEVTENNQNE